MKDSIGNLLEPKSLALIGIPRRTGHASFNILENLVNSGYTGKLYPVNPNAADIMGVRCYASVESLPEGIETALIVLPRQLVPGAVRACAARGIVAVIIPSTGFAESDAEGRKLEKEIAQICRQTGIRVLGPNSLGVINNFYNFRTTFLPSFKTKTPVGLISQSGGFLTGFSNFAAGKGIDVGNCCDVDFPEALQYFEQDPDVRVIVLHIEGLRSARDFISAAASASRTKPVLVLKSGRSDKAAQAAASHTGSLTGLDEVYSQAFRQAGLLRVRDVEELGDVTNAFLYVKPFTGRRVAVITPTGAAGVLALDAMAESGFVPADLSPSTIENLRAVFPPWSPPANPLDMLYSGMIYGYGKVFRQLIEACMSDPGVDIVLCISGAPTMRTAKHMFDEGAPKPVATWVVEQWDHKVLSVVDELDYRAIFPTPERAFRALSAVRDYNSARTVRGE